MQRKVFPLLVLLVTVILLIPGSVYALSFFNYGVYGGTYQDAEKSPTNTEDDYLCWAATASNMLNWTYWGDIYSNSEDEIFEYFQDHWTDLGGNMYFGLKWWFTGKNDSQGFSGWSQVDVPGGGFYPTENFIDYYLWSSDDSVALDTINTYLHEGRGVGLSLSGGGGHAITCWGYEYDKSGNYLGIWVTDSDDHKHVNGAPDELKYYDVVLSGGAWYLQDYYGTYNWFISEVHGLAQYPNPVPEPATMLLVGTGLVGLAGLRRKFKK